MADHHPPYLFGRRPQIAAGGEFRGSFDSLRPFGSSFAQDDNEGEPSLGMTGSGPSLGITELVG
jgi:hypothetical protein